MNQSVVIEINNANVTIDDNISKKDYLERGLLSQNILSQLRNLIEDIIVLWYNKKFNTNLSNSFSDKKTAYKELNRRCNPRFLYDFHRYLQSSKSHYTPDYNGAELLMQKYYYYLLKTKEYVKDEFNLDILMNIKNYPLNNDSSLDDYYKKIAEVVESVDNESKKINNARYYVEKIKPLYIKDNIYYEITLSIASDKINKFDRIIAYTKEDILPNYAITISLVEKKIKLFSSDTSVKIINNWRVAIRSCEFNNLAKILNINSVVKSNMIEYNKLMNYLTNTNNNLLNLLLLPNDLYLNEIKNIGEAPTDYLFQLFDSLREIINNKRPGYRVLRYLIYTIKNIYIKRQLNKNIPNEHLSNLCLKRQCYPFEKLPFILSLSQHTPSGEDLFLSQEDEDNNYQLLARHILNNIEQQGILYTPIDELAEYGNIDELINIFNSKLYGNQKLLKIVKESNNVFMMGYEKSTIDTINLINDLTNKGIEGYKESFKYWEDEIGFSTSISDEKKEILRKMYCDSRVALIYGPAGTGKTTIINSLSEYLSDKTKIYLANTNTAVENLKHRINVSNSIFYTIAEYNKNEYINKCCDILVVDECSTVSNEDILKALSESDYTLLLLVGDIYQIESIRFGNWFYFCKQFINNNSIYELTETFRSNEEVLLTLWDKVRNFDDKITEYMASKHLSSPLNKEIFKKKDNDEIILCLGYDGLYGINQINKYLQDNNPNPKFEFGIKTYKVGDKVLFFETERFKKVLYNNLKGVISNIKEDTETMYFEVEIEKPLNELDVINSNVDLIKTSSNKSVIGFSIDKEFENDDDDDDKNNIVPFNVAYAISIHKAQGLEYNSVKVVITKNIEKMISSNIFYTSVTRAKKYLTVFWTVETAEHVIEQIKSSVNRRDFNIFKNKYNDEIVEHIKSS